MPRVNFSARSIETLRPTEKRDEYWDESDPGFGLRVSPEGRKSWIYMYRVGRRLRRFTLGTYPSTSLAEARRLVLEAKYSVSQGGDPAHRRQLERKAETFDDLVSEYLQHHAKTKKKSWKTDERFFNREFLPLWKNCKATAIQRRDVILALDTIVERGSPICANKALAILRKAFNFAVQRDIVETNPCWNVAAPAKPRARNRVLGDNEIRSLWTTLDNEEILTASYFKLLLLTAQRPGEVAKAEWKEIDLDARWWTIPMEKSKNGLPHRVPLSKGAITTLKTLKLSNGGSRWVFPSAKGDFPIVERKRRLRSIRLRCSLEFCPHDLRRTVASRMTSMGISRLTVSKILNHVEASVTSVYDRHSYDREKMNALDSWNERLKFVLNAGETEQVEENKKSNVNLLTL